MALHSGLLKGALSLCVADCGSFPERVVIKFLPLYFLLYFLHTLSVLSTYLSIQYISRILGFTAEIQEWI